MDDLGKHWHETHKYANLWLRRKWTDVEPIVVKAQVPDKTKSLQLSFLGQNFKVIFKLILCIL